MLNVDTAKAVWSNIGRKGDFVGQGRTCRLRGLRDDVSSQSISDEIDGNGTSGAIAGGGNGFGNRSYGSVVVFHQIEVDSLGMLGGADDAETIAGECLGVELQTDVHILSGGGAEALSGRLGGIYQQRQVHVAILLVCWCVHDAGTTLGLQKPHSNGTVEAFLVFPHGFVRIERP